MTRMAAEQRREELVQAALRVMAREGVAAATTRAIVAEAGMTLGTFHYCFDSKRTLLRRVTEVVVSREVETARNAVESGGSLEEMLRNGLAGYWDLVEADPGEHLVTYELTQYALRTPGEEELARFQYGHYQQAAEAVLAACEKATGVTWAVPRAMLARMMVSLLDGVVLRWLADRDSAGARTMLATLADHIVAKAIHPGEPCVAAGDETRTSDLVS